MCSLSKLHSADSKGCYRPALQPQIIRQESKKFVNKSFIFTNDSLSERLKTNPYPDQMQTGAPYRADRRNTTCDVRLINCLPQGAQLPRVRDSKRVSRVASHKMCTEHLHLEFPLARHFFACSCSNSCTPPISSPHVTPVPLPLFCLSLISLGT